jgi:hypothetical protein
MRRQLIGFLMLAAVLIGVSLAYVAALNQNPHDYSADDLMEQIYGPFDQTHGCWLRSDEPKNITFCMHIDAQWSEPHGKGVRLHVLATGPAQDRRGAAQDGHSQGGIVGVFVADIVDGQMTLVSSDRAIEMGSFGAAPEKWQRVKLGPDYFGWRNEVGFCNQGYCVDTYAILAPYDKGIRNLASPTIFASQSNEGAVDCAASQEQSCHVEVMESSLDIDSTAARTKVYPLRITVRSTLDGAKISPSVWIVKFDPKKWQYVIPKNYPVKGF